MQFPKRLLLYLVFISVSCTAPTYPPVENPLDAGRQFAEAIFKGNFERARQLIVPDEENKALLQQKLEDEYHQRSSNDRNSMAQESLQIQNVQTVTKDSIMLIRLINAYDGKPAELKVVKNNNSWLVDLKYTFSANR